MCHSVTVGLRFCDKRQIDGLPCEDAIGDEPDPHLHRQCQRCGFAWVEHPAGHPASQDRPKPDCGFCSKPIGQVRVMVAGPLFGICDECTITAFATVQAALDKVSSPAEG